ncbi:hypothetical protein Poly51_02790 [Rubripirellula tenax]|uniref:Uncharacterized protein n=1 Tax=Rubripirellula tenax TaxID=2528015 RepID=A0A5C6FDX1_9BACT|nr:hypothetical protein [Rubripirellula tenax]TWU60006.1 hypothetical protein Poly51_02790 [Rubripirellula tenax]
MTNPTTTQAIESEPGGESKLTPDQIAVAAYFASDQYKQSRSKSDESDEAIADPGSGRVLRAYTLELEKEDGLSIAMAFYGLGAFWILSAMAAAYGIWILGGFMNLTFAFWIAMVQFTFAPIFVCLSMIAVTSSMWYVSLAKRFFVAVMMLTPGVMMLMFGLEPLAFLDAGDVWPKVALQVLAYAVACAVVSLPMQLWGGWSLSQARETPRQLPRLGTYEILELITIASILFAIAVLVRNRDTWREIVVASVVAIVTTVGVIAVIASRLNPDGPRWFGTFVGFVCGYIAMLIASMYAFSRFDETIYSLNQDQQWNIVMIASVVGTALFMLTLTLGQWWLRACGWQCVIRRGGDQNGEQPSE